MGGMHATTIADKLLQLALLGLADGIDKGKLDKDLNRIAPKSGSRTKSRILHSLSTFFREAAKGASVEFKLQEVPVNPKMRDAGIKAWETRRRNAAKANVTPLPVAKQIQQEAGRKSWETRRANMAEKKRIQQDAGRKSWETRRKNQRQLAVA